MRIGQNNKYQSCSSCFYVQVFYWQKFEFSSNIERKAKLKSSKVVNLTETLVRVKNHQIQWAINPKIMSFSSNSQYESCSPWLPLKLCWFQKLRCNAKIEQKVKLKIIKTQCLNEFLWNLKLWSSIIQNLARIRENPKHENFSP